MSRIDKINQTMKKEIGLIIHREVKDPRLDFVTITQVSVTKDLQQAKVYFTVLGKQEQWDKAKEGLDHARGFIRKQVGARVRMRYTPELDFIFDQTVEYSARIEAALEEIRHERSKDHPDDKAA